MGLDSCFDTLLEIRILLRTKYARMDQVKFDPFKFFKGCLPQILLDPFLNICLI